MAIQIGCQTYTWQMSYDKYAGELAHILDILKTSEFKGVEAEVCMLGHFYDDPVAFAEELNKRNLHLSALTLALPWQLEQETQQEKEEAEKLFRYLKHFPQTHLVLVQLPGEDRSQLYERQKGGLSCVNEVAKRAQDKGISSSFHPNSPSGSVFRVKEDYEILFDGLDDRYVGYCPDSGHIANGEMDVLQIFRQSMSMIKHVHFKDMTLDRQWTSMGEGMIDHVGIIQMLNESGYNGWVMIEEESKRAESAPDTVTIENGRYARSHLLR